MRSSARRGVMRNPAVSEMPEFTAPGLGRQSSKVVIDLETGNNANGVLYSLGGFSGGLTLFMENGKVVYEYNMMMIERYTGETKEALSPGRHEIEVVTQILSPFE